MIFWAVNSIFLLFAVLNINDPDWFLWLPTYLLVVLTTIAYRKNRVNKKAVNLWIVSDNLLKGAALNTVQIAEKLVSYKLINQ